jgi:ABC-type multidrug transport system fused ATPase/permease subunit
MLTGPLSAIARQYETFCNGVSAAGRVFELLNEKIAHPRSDIVAPPAHAQGASVEIAELQVPGRDGRPILDNISVSITPGEMVAIVGHSGAGKTTLAEAILGLRDYSRGDIRIDGTDLAMWPEQRLREQTAMLFQDPVLFRGSIADNVLFGAPVGGSADPTECLTKANAEGFVASLPLGADTPIGEEGHGLSTGERRRIALARGLARSPRLLILDEPTASVDGEAERRIQSALIGLRGTLTCIVISHQPSMARIADRVVFLRNGSIAAEGAHLSLLAQCPGYAEMFGAEVGGDHAVIAQTFGGSAP